ncbi:MAG TPA: LPP20 family lipoprotein [Myxococcales bacterium]|nr:LPP20 family lipoprotein [Myxococcales bacterium]
MLAAALAAVRAEAACPAWKNDPAAAGLGDQFLVGTGSAAGEGPAAVNEAQKAALSAIASQIQVTVTAMNKTLGSVQIRNGQTNETLSTQDLVQTDSKVALKGAENKATCTDGGSTYALAALDRKLFVANLRSGIDARLPRLQELEAKASQLLEKRPLDAASRWSEAAVIADAIEVDADLVRLVGKDATYAAAHTSADTLREHLREAAAKTTLFVRVTPPEGTQTLQHLAEGCVTRAGIGVTTSEAKATGVLTLDVQSETPNLAGGVLYMVRSTMSASLQPKSGEPIRSGAAVEVKTGARTAEQAVQRAIGLLAKDKVAGLVDELFGKGGWTLQRCSN